MATKKRKKPGLPEYSCLGCGGKLKRKWACCPKCARANPGHESAGKSAVPMFTGKSGRPRCPNPNCGKTGGYVGQRYCARCGSGMLAGLAGVAKSMEMAMLTKVTAEHDPAVRERLYRAAFPSYGPPNGGAA